MVKNLILTKLNNSPLGFIERLDEIKSKRMGGVNTNYIPSVDDVANIINSIPKGQTRTIKDLRRELAKLHQTDTACPAKIIKYWKWMANLSDELKEVYIKYDIPWWRVLKDGKLSKHMPGGVAQQKKLLDSEGVLLIKHND
jgi:alkylated DNA nucleotide flippase Atl1